MSVDGDSVHTLKDFENLSKEIASATPTGVQKASYTPANTALQKCPPVNSNWLATASPLPPSPNLDLCSCMEKTLTCVLKDSVSEKEYGDLFGTVCGYGACAGITPNATSGEYGAYSVCSPKQQLSHAFDQYYQAQAAKGNAASACDFGGAATTQAATKASGGCAGLIKEAGTAGTGTVTSSPTGTAGSGAGGAGGAGASTSQGAAHPMAAPGSVNFGSMQLGLYVATAFVAGMGMILL